MEGGCIMKEIKEFLGNRRDEFRDNYQKYGDSSQSLNVRIINQYAGFISLMQNIDLSQKSILDIGCGLGDFNHYLALEDIKDYSYLGVDIVEEFIVAANKKYGTSQIKFRQGNFIDDTFEEAFDYIIGNQIFYRKIRDMDTILYIKDIMDKAYSMCHKGIMFNFLSDYADLQYEANFYMKPEEILTYAYSLSKNIILRNDYSPFEFSIIILKENDIHVRPTYFYTFAQQNLNILSTVYKNLEQELGDRG